MKPVLVTFDTGACGTVITLNSLLRELSKNNTKLENKDSLVKKVTKNKFTREFKSASGNNITGVLSCLKDATLGTITISPFYFYLVTDCNVEIALLGNDFLHYCKYIHSECDNIEILGFDQNSYNSYYKNIAVKTSNEILDLQSFVKIKEE